MTIPIEDHKWHRIPEEELKMLPKDHYGEYARTGNNELTARIVGPRAHVFGKDPNVWAAVQKALDWFYQVGGCL